jgi:hypothetical protein
MVGNRIKVSPLVMEKSTTTRMDFTPSLTFKNPAQAVFAKTKSIRERVFLNMNLIRKEEMVTVMLIFRYFV